MSFFIEAEAADDAGFTAGVVTLTLSLRGADDTLESEGEEVVAWDYSKGKADIDRLVVTMYFDRMSVIESDQDNGDWWLWRELCRKPYKRIIDTDLPRVARAFAPDGTRGDVYNLWTGTLSDPDLGLCPWLFECSGHAKAKWNEFGKQDVSSTLFSAEVML